MRNLYFAVVVVAGASCRPGPLVVGVGDAGEPQSVCDAFAVRCGTLEQLDGTVIESGPIGTKRFGVESLKLTPPF